MRHAASILVSASTEPSRPRTKRSLSSASSGRTSVLRSASIPDAGVHWSMNTLQADIYLREGLKTQNSLQPPGKWKEGCPKDTPQLGDQDAPQILLPATSIHLQYAAVASVAVFSV